MQVGVSIACDHPDVTAIKIWTADTQILIFSVYLACIPLFTPDEASAELALRAIQNATISISNTREGQRTTSVILSASTAVSRDGRRHSGSSTTQTITNRPDLLFKCHLYYKNYESDHHATYSEWNLKSQRQLAAKAKKVYERADWYKIAEDVLRQIGPWKEGRQDWR
ncbi:hypothetical protein N7467_012344 [Penicillium canescens]|nr:hypothetical protein N7467_012344 [Penicillium canescens]